jgi:magnesium chelatase subunit D
MSGDVSPQGSGAAAWDEACLATALLAVDPGLGGIALRAGAGPVREAWLAALARLRQGQPPPRRMPANIRDERLLGGLDLTATLRAGRPVAEAGLLAEANGGLLLIPMAERLPTGTAARIAGAMDAGEILIERDGFTLRRPTRFALVALDEGQADDERVPAALLDRMAFHISLDGISHRDIGAAIANEADVSAARRRLADVMVDERVIATLVQIAARLGVDSLRAPLLALRVARAAAALRAGDVVEDEDITCAARFVLAPRATMSGAPPETADDPAQTAEEHEPDEADRGADRKTDPDEPEATAAQDERIIAAARAAIPAGLLAQIEAGRMQPARNERSGKAGGEATSSRRGRPISARQGALRDGRLALIDTLRAAAPWQRVRRAHLAQAGKPAQRVIVRPEDVRIHRFREQRETAAIFVVDASGSSAMQRLAEVKGAIELLLVDCYVRRDQVALVAFRGKGAEIVLPPTRSLARAKRMLAGLPGGGGTPIAAGLETAFTLADAVRRKGQSPLVVLMTDGRANVGRDGAGGRARAFEEALQAGRQIGAAGFAALAIDTAPALRGSGEAPTLRLGQAMNARYIQLPYANASLVSDAVRAASPAS